MNQVQAFNKQYQASKTVSDQAKKNLIDYLRKPQIADLWLSYFDSPIRSDQKDAQVAIDAILMNADDKALAKMVLAVSEFLDLHED